MQAVAILDKKLEIKSSIFTGLFLLFSKIFLLSKNILS